MFKPHKAVGSSTDLDPDGGLKSANPDRHTIGESSTASLHLKRLLNTRSRVLPPNQSSQTFDDDRTTATTSSYNHRPYPSTSPHYPYSAAARHSAASHTLGKEREPGSIRFHHTVEDIQSVGAYRHIHARSSSHPYATCHPPKRKLTVRCPGGRSVEYLTIKMQNLEHSEAHKGDDALDVDTSTEAVGEEEEQIRSGQDVYRPPKFIRRPTPSSRMDRTESADEDELS